MPKPPKSSTEKQLYLSDGTEFQLRPLQRLDEEMLFQFFESLSDESSQFTRYEKRESRLNARKHCLEVSRWNNRRWVVLLPEDEIAGLFELSFELDPDDCFRYDDFGIYLDPQRTARFAPCIRDKWLRKGMGTEVWSTLLAICRKQRVKRIILWGGVQLDNTAAVDFYRSLGFVPATPFTNPEGLECVDMWRWI